MEQTQSIVMCKSYRAHAAVVCSFVRLMTIYYYSACHDDIVLTCSWSFGVTLWELVTIGGTPYADIVPEELYTQLQSGMRMLCPPHCSEEV